MSGRSHCTVYVGNLPGDMRESEVEDLFAKYGKILDIELKLPPRPPGFAFVEFEDPRDAEDAIRGRDEYDFDRNRLRAELASSPPLPSFPFPPSHHPLPPSPFSLPPSVSLCPLALCNHVPPRYNPVPSSPHFTNPQFADPRDTKDAIRRRDEYDFDENCLRVELAHGGREGGGGFGVDRGRGGGLSSGGGRAEQSTASAKRQFDRQRLPSRSIRIQPRSAVFTLLRDSNA
ncbi:unnamed protein product [Closterium sp. NIES-54]